MSHDPDRIRRLYARLIACYPRAFREQLGEPMAQTFGDLLDERRRAGDGMLGFVLWAFAETSWGLIREHLALIANGGAVQMMLKTTGASALIGAALILPLLLLEVVNRRQLGEDFPSALFYALWLNVFAIGMILLPLVWGRRAAQSGARPAPVSRPGIFSRPGPAALLGVALLFSPALLSLLDSIGWISLARLFDSPSPGQPNVLGQLLALVLAPAAGVAAGLVASRPVVLALRDGRGLLAHPLNLVIAGLIVATFAAGLAVILIDQWPCFMGVPVCD